MAINRPAYGLAVLRVLLGVFFLFEGINKAAWLLDSTPLASQLTGWLENANALSRWYLTTVCLPGAKVFARLVMLGETATGVALILGVWPRLAATLALLMVLNIHLASGAFFQYRFLTNGYGFPVLGGLFALAMGAVHLPFSLRR